MHFKESRIGYSEDVKTVVLDQVVFDTVAIEGGGLTGEDSILLTVLRADGTPYQSGVVPVWRKYFSDNGADFFGWTIFLTLPTVAAKETIKLVWRARVGIGDKTLVDHIDVLPRPD